MQLIVLGMHRSGTSVLARMLNLMGAYFGPEGMSTGANVENPKGFWERRDVRQLNDALLHSVGYDWDRIGRFDVEQLPRPAVEAFTAQASRLVLEMDAHRPWMLKEPRLCLLLPVWRRILEAPVLVHIVRHPLEVASSLRRRNDMPIPVGLALWERYVRAAINASADEPAVLVSHAGMLSDPAGTLMKLHTDLGELGVGGLRMPSLHEIGSFIEPRLHRERQDRADLQEYAHAPQVPLFESLVSQSWPPAALPPPSPGIDETLAAYERGLPPLRPPINNLLSGGARQARERSMPSSNEPHPSHAEEIFRLTRLSMSREDALRRKLASRERELDATAGRSKEATRQLEDAGTRLRALERELVARAQEAEHYRRKAAQTAEAAESELRAARARIDRLVANLTSRQQRLDQVEASISWKLTAPLRWLRKTGTRDPASDRETAVAALRRCGLFDPEWYLATYPDIADSGVDPAEHYLRHGAAEGRDPSPAFSTKAYLRSHPELMVTRENPLLHHVATQQAANAGAALPSFPGGRQ